MTVLKNLDTLKMSLVSLPLMCMLLSLFRAFASRLRDFARLSSWLGRCAELAAFSSFRCSISLDCSRSSCWVAASSEENGGIEFCAGEGATPPSWAGLTSWPCGRLMLPQLTVLRSWVANGVSSASCRCEFAPVVVAGVANPFGCACCCTWYVAWLAVCCAKPASAALEDGVPPGLVAGVELTLANVVRSEVGLSCISVAGAVDGGWPGGVEAMLTMSGVLGTVSLIGVPLVC